MARRLPVTRSFEPEGEIAGPARFQRPTPEARSTRDELDRKEAEARGISVPRVRAMRVINPRYRDAMKKLDDVLTAINTGERGLYEIHEADAKKMRDAIYKKADAIYNAVVVGGYVAEGEITE